MKIDVYSVFDVKAAVFANPFFMPGDSVAVRGFTDAVNAPESMLFKHPEDYSLYRLGVFDDSVGTLVSEPQPVVLCTAASVAAVRGSREVTPEVLAGRAHIAGSVDSIKKGVK